MTPRRRTGWPTPTSTRTSPLTRRVTTGWMPRRSAALEGTTTLDAGGSKNLVDGFAMLRSRQRITLSVEGLNVRRFLIAATVHSMRLRRGHSKRRDTWSD